MARHAIALGYLFLAVFCVLTSAHSFVELRWPLLAAALMAVAAAAGYLSQPVGAKLRAGLGMLRDAPAWLVRMIRLAQEPPKRAPSTTDETSA